jgi:hypothetical protein
MCRESRAPWIGTPRGAMLPGPWPVISPWPLRGRKAPRGPWDPSCARPGMDTQPTWPLARWCVAPRPSFFPIPGTRPCMVLVHAGLLAVPCRPLPAASGVAVRACLTPGASSGEDNIVAVWQGRTSFAGARRQAPARQRVPQGYGGESGLRRLAERRPQLPPPAPGARSMLGPDLRTHDGVEIPGSPTRGCPTRVRRVGLAGGPRVTRRGPHALDRACSTLQGLGGAPCGVPGRYGLRGLPFLITMACAVHAQLGHGWSQVFPLKRHSDDRTVGVAPGHGGR